MRLSFLLICIVVAIVLGLIFGWQVRGRIAARQQAAAEDKDRPIRDAVVSRVRTGLRGLIFGGGKAKAKPKSDSKSQSKSDSDDSKA